MAKLLKIGLATALLAISPAAVQAGKVLLPGATLSTPVRTAESNGLAIQPGHNPGNVAGGTATPDCPHIGKTLRELLNYARFNWPALYRQALALRRGGATKPFVRDFLENAICTQEGF